MLFSLVFKHISLVVVSSCMGSSLNFILVFLSLNFSSVLVLGKVMKLLSVSINFSLVIVQLVIQEIQLKWINTIDSLHTIT